MSSSHQVVATVGNPTRIAAVALVVITIPG